MRNDLAYRDLLIVLALTMLTACSATTDPTRFYSLKQLNPNFDTTLSVAKKNNSIAIESITIPRLLERPQIVSRIGKNEIERSEFHQWGGSITEEIEQVISKSLQQQLENSNYSLLPKQSRIRPDYSLYVQIIRLDGELGDSAIIEMNWQLESENTNDISDRGIIQHTTKLASKKHSDYVSALQQLLVKSIETLSQQIISQ